MITTIAFGGCGARTTRSSRRPAMDGNDASVQREAQASYRADKGRLDSEPKIGFVHTLTQPTLRIKPAKRPSSSTLITRNLVLGPRPHRMLTMAISVTGRLPA